MDDSCPSKLTNILCGWEVEPTDLIVVGFKLELLKGWEHVVDFLECSVEAKAM